ncbi:AAA family ATPase [Anabaena sp. CCY 9613]|uniref:trifunctional serine/threonine-protein kinase/ATP-binding protein/sensor histidine kinase n=1 Tax=Anabaena sp. CCY 9613 TaxID=3103868 RepID=UPI0039C5B2FD
MISIPGYCLSEKLYDGSRTLVYRGNRETDSLSIVIKLLKNPYPSFSELVQFRNQYTIAKNLNYPGIVQTYSLERFKNGHILVMEDFGGISLKSYFANNNHVPSLDEFLQIAIAVCDTLDRLYRDRIIHKDIKPANILINPDTKQVKLIDFSIASLLAKENQEIKSPNVLEGTLAYISPEQTGRMNRGIDYRSDFYSLGVTFYELLTGELPFISDDPMELVHCHIAKQPPNINIPHPNLILINSREREGMNIPQVIVDIIFKLMAKNAEDRYQSALGLKHDLETCLYQRKETGKINYFEIGQRDICDRFLIPEKLYGREIEVEQLLAAFEQVSQGNSEVMLVAGFSGIGKTAIVNEVHKPIVQRRGYFIKGKFDQFNRNIPFSAFVQTFRDLMGQLLSESDAQLSSWKNKILQAVGENGQVIIDVIPELERIIGVQPSAPELSGIAAQNRFNLLFQKFIQVFTQPEHPLVMFLDDLQWADSASLNLIQLLMAESGTGYLLMIGAYRDNEVFAAHPLMLTLDAITKTGTKVNTITLKPLSHDSLNHLVADTLNCATAGASEAIALAQPLTELVYQKTQGNPFFTTQFLKALHQDQLITFDTQARHWQCDIVRVREAALTDDVVELMATQLQKLPEITQNILKLAACIGNSFDLNTLAIIAEQSTIEIATALWTALQEGLILSQSEIYKFYIGEAVQNVDLNAQVAHYKFLHDRVQQAAYLIIPENQKQSTHLKIGWLLLRNTSAAEREEQIFAIVNQLNMGRGLIIQAAERDQLLHLNLMAVQKAKTSTAYGAATQYLEICIELLPEDSWQSQTDLTRTIYELATEVAYLNTNYEQMEQLAAIFLSHTDSFIEKIRVYEIKMLGAKAQGQLRESIQIGLQLLKLLGVEFPEQPTSADIGQALEQTLLKWKDLSIPSLLDLAVMTDPSKLAAMRILTQMIAPAYQSFPILMPLLIFEQINLCIAEGNCEVSAFSYADYGLVLCGIVGDLDAGYQFGQLALNILDRFQEKACKCRTYFIVHSYISHWKESLSSRLPFFREAYQVGLETGDLESSALNAQMYCANAYFAGHELPTLAAEMETYRQGLLQLKQETALNYQAIYHQTVLNLLGQSDDPCRLDGEVYTETQTLPTLQQSNHRTALYYLYYNKTVLSCLFGQYQQAANYAALVESYADSMVGMFAIALFCFYSSLIYLKLYSSINETEQARYLDKIAVNQQKLKAWADHAPMNHLHKFYLVEAERHRILGEKIEAMEMYDRAIALAKENGYIQEEALANELASKFYLDWGKKQFAQIHIADAYYCYARWGAKAKITHLEQKYPQLLAAILQAPTLPITHEGTIAPTLMRSFTNVNSSQNLWLDFPAVMKAAQAISQEIELEKLLATLIQMAITLAGAQIGRLIVRQDEQWLVVAQADSMQTHRLEILLEQCQEIPQSVIYAVARTQQTTVFENLSYSAQFAGDRYVITHQPKSVLCTPISQQGKLIGILYLENNLTVGAFTSDRLQVIQLLTAQAAISLENAQLYCQLEKYSHTLEQKVSERTQELTEKATQLESILQELQRTQTQLLQSEKMSSLGQLVAGIAHEINNPVNFIHGNISHVKQYTQDLLKLVNLYQQSNINQVEIPELLDEIDLDFLQKDLPKTLKSMQVGTERIREIVLSLRTFSRMDEAEFKQVDIHAGIDSTLMILQHRLKEKAECPAIEIIKDYGKLPVIECYAGQLNQVFMNILTNAIDAIEEKNLQQNFEEIEANPQQIKIRTSVIDTNWIEIAIIDNGIGITSEVQQKIFNPFFTTKSVGKGTGMGMSISYQIITEKHGGKLKCVSIPNQGTEFVLQIPIRQSSVNQKVFLKE